MSQTTIPVTIDKSHLTTIGRRLYSESLDLVRELVANAYDADATVVKISLSGGGLTVWDNGLGMDRDGLVQYFTIGSVFKKLTPVTEKFNRQRIGEFGIGKFAVLSICDRFELTTQKNGYAATVIFDKNDFETRDNWEVPLVEQTSSRKTSYTRISLFDLQSPLPRETLEHRLRQQLPLNQKNFTLFVNDTELKPRHIPGRRFLIREQTRFGTIGGGKVERVVVEQAREVAATGQPRRIFHHLVRDLRVRVHFGHIFVLLDCLNEMHEVLRGGQVVDRRFLRRDVLESGGGDFKFLVLEKIAHLGPVVAARHDVHGSILHPFDLFRAGIDQLQLQIVAVHGACFLSHHHTFLIEHPEHGVGFRPSAATTFNDGANTGDGAVPVIRQTFDDHGGIAWSVGGVEHHPHLFPLELACSLLDRAFNVGVRHAFRFGIVDCGAQGRVHDRIAAAFRRDFDQARMARVDFPAPGILRGFADLDVGPFTVTRHGTSIEKFCAKKSGNGFL